MRVKKIYYTAEVAATKLNHYLGLEEKYQRHFLGVEYSCLGRGSQRYLAALYKCSRHRIANGYEEISALQALGECADYGRQRKVGGGAKKRSSHTQFIYLNSKLYWRKCGG